MEYDNEQKAKKLIFLSNKELEAHNFSKAEKLCNEALEFDSENPNIYLILLLAKHEVTEIEDLKNCNIDFQSDLYKNLRKYANEELNDELNKYIPIKYLTDSNNFEQRMKQSSASSELLQYIKNEFKTLFEKKDPTTTNPRIISDAEGQATLIIFFSVFLLFMVSFITVPMVIVISDKYYIDTICVYFILYLFWTKIIRLNNTVPLKEDILPDKNNNEAMSSLNFKAFKHLFLYIICMIEIYCLFFFSLFTLIHSGMSEGKDNFFYSSKILDIILGFPLGLIPGLTVTYAYRKIYNFCRNMKYISSPETNNS